MAKKKVKKKNRLKSKAKRVGVSRKVKRKKSPKTSKSKVLNACVAPAPTSVDTDFEPTHASNDIETFETEPPFGEDVMDKEPEEFNDEEFDNTGNFEGNF